MPDSWRVLACPLADVLVIEDSLSGVTAAVAASMPVIGMLAGSHVGADHGARLLAAGASAIAEDYEAVSAWMAH